MKDIVLFWIPGAWKWTQADLFLDKKWEHYSHISPGNVFRSLVSKPNAIWRYVTQQMEKGQLVDDQVTISLFQAYFFTVLDQEKLMLLDWYPRSLTQLESFLQLVDLHNRDVVWVYFDLSDEEAINRMLSRAREWEDRAMIQTRLDEYYTKTQPVTDAFAAQLPLIKIDASWSIEDIHTTVLSHLDS